MVNLEMRRSSALGAMNATAVPLAQGDAGVEQTVRAMRNLIEQGKKDPVVHELAATILRSQGVPAFDWAGEARAIYNWVLQNIRFTRDVYGKETLHSAREIIRLGIGDCDDFTILICSLAATIGHATRIVTVAKTEDEGNFSHVFPQVCLDGEWISLDAARKNPGFGRSPEHAARIRVWNTQSDDFVDIRGLGGPAGVGPRSIPSAYAPWVADPRYRNLRGHGLYGMGNYGRHKVIAALRQRRGMGDDSFDAGDITSLITASTQGAANIISATRANPYNLFPTTSGVQTSTPLQRSLVTAPVSAFGGIPTSTLLLGAGAIALAIFASERR